MAAARPKIYVFILLLDSRKFETVGKVNQRTRTYQSGDPILWFGKDAVVLGTGLTRLEAKTNGTEYYNDVCEVHKEEAGYEFETQSVDLCLTSHKYGPPKKKRRTK